MGGLKNFSLVFVKGLVFTQKSTLIDILFMVVEGIKAVKELRILFRNSLVVSLLHTIESRLDMILVTLLPRVRPKVFYGSFNLSKTY